MATLAELAINVKVNADGLAKLRKELGTTSQQAGAFKKDILTARNAMVLFAGATGAAFAAKKLFDLGAAVGETASKYTTVFGPAVAEANDFLAEFANMAGLSDTAAKDLAGTTGAIVQGFGFAQAESAKLSAEILTLAGDFASFNNLKTEDTARTVQAALTGEFESMKRLGVVLRATEVEQRALAQSGKTTAEALTQQEKVTATLALISEKAGVQMGDLVRTQTSAANRSKQLGATLLDLRDVFAVALQPAFAVMFEELSGGVDGMESLTGAVQRSAPVIAAWATVAVKAFQLFASIIVAPIRLAFNLGQNMVLLGNIVEKFLTRDLAGMREDMASFGGNMRDMEDAIFDVSEDMLDFGAAFKDAFFAFPQAIADTDTLAASLINVDAILARSTVDYKNMTPVVQNLTGGFADLRFELHLSRDEIKRYEAGFTGLNDQLTATEQKLLGVASAAGRLAGGGGIGGFLKSAVKIGASFIPGAGPYIGAGLQGLGFDHGGTIGAGQAGIVGERGPELVRGPAHVTGRTDTAAMMGGGDTVVNIVIEQGGVPVRTITARQRRDSLLGKTHRLALPAAVV